MQAAEKRPIEANTAAGRRIGENPGDGHMNRLAWLITVIIALITALVLLIEGYTGYAGLGLAVAIAAAINLR